MSARYIARREAIGVVRSRFGEALSDLGMKRIRREEGWMRELPGGRSAVGVWVQFSNASRAFGLSLSKSAGAVTCVRAEVGVGPLGWEMHNYAVGVNTVQLVPPNLDDQARARMRMRAGQIVNELLAESSPSAREDLWFAEMRLAGDDAFYPLSTYSELDYWCQEAGSIVARLVGEILQRSGS